MATLAIAVVLDAAQAELGAAPGAHLEVVLGAAGARRAGQLVARTLRVGRDRGAALGATAALAAPPWTRTPAPRRSRGRWCAIDAGLNVFAARHCSPRVMTWLHACYGIGASAGPLLMSSVIVAGLTWRWGFAAVAALLLAISICFLLTQKLWSDDGRAGARAQSSEAASVTRAHAMRRALVWMHSGLFFCYSGIEATTSQWAYSLLTEGRGMSPRLAGASASIFWLMLTAGRVAFGQLAARVAPDAILRATLLGCPLAAALLWLDLSPAANVAALALLGLACAPIFPLLVSVTPVRVGDAHAPHAIGLQIAAAYLGLAAIPGLTGVLARWYGNGGDRARHRELRHRHAAPARSRAPPRARRGRRRRAIRLIARTAGDGARTSTRHRHASGFRVRTRRAAQERPVLRDDRVSEGVRVGAARAEFEGRHPPVAVEQHLGRAQVVPQRGGVPERRLVPVQHAREAVLGERGRAKHHVDVRAGLALVPLVAGLPEAVVYLDADPAAPGDLAAPLDRDLLASVHVQVGFG